MPQITFNKTSIRIIHYFYTPLRIINIVLDVKVLSAAHATKSSEKREEEQSSILCFR